MSRGSCQVSWEQPVSPRGNVPYFSRFVRRAAPGGKFYCIPFLCAVLWESWRSSIHSSSSPLVGTGEKVWGCAREQERTTCSALAVIGYIFIIIYSNRKRYLGMGGETRIRSRSSVVGRRDDDGRCKFLCLCGPACPCLVFFTYSERYTHSESSSSYIFSSRRRLRLLACLRRYHI